MQADGTAIATTLSQIGSFVASFHYLWKNHDKFEFELKKDYGCVNNVPKKPRRIGGRWSVLDRLHIKQAERKQKEQTQQQQQERSWKN